MALSTPTFAGSATDTNATATSTSFNTTVTANAGDLLVYCGSCGTAGNTLTSVSCGGLTWTVNDTVARGTAIGLGIGYALAPSGLASGTGLTATWNATAAGHLGGVYIISGAASASVRDTGATGNGVATTTPVTSSFTTTNAADIIIACRGTNDNSTDVSWTAGSGYTKCPSGTILLSTTRSLLCEYQIVAATGTYTAGMTTTSIQYAMVATAFKESAVAAVVLPERNTPRTHP